MLESISSTKICRISCENPLSPPENIARIGFRKSKVVANPKTPQIISVANTVPKTFKARSLLPPPIFCRIIAAPPSPILPAGTVDLFHQNLPLGRSSIFQTHIQAIYVFHTYLSLPFILRAATCSQLPRKSSCLRR